MSPFAVNVNVDHLQHKAVFGIVNKPAAMLCLRSPFALNVNVDHIQHTAAVRAHRIPVASQQTVLINAREKPATTASSDVHATPQTADVVVVGTGILGLTVARELAMRGSKVTLIGVAQDPTAASFAAGAMIDAFGELESSKEFLGREQLRLRVDAQRGYKGWLNILQDDTETSVFHREGMFIVGNIGGHDDVTKMSYIEASLDEYKEPYELVAANDIEGLAPHLRFQAHSAMRLPGAITVDSHKLLHALGTFAERSPMISWHQYQCRSLEMLSREWLVELANGDKVSTPKLVLCAGAFSQALLGEQLWQNAGLPNLHFGRGTSVIVSGMPALPHGIRTPNRELACGFHMVPRDNGHWYLGSTNVFGTRLASAKGPTCGELHRLLGETAAELNTSLRTATIVQVGWGLRPVTSNGAPVFGSTKLDGLFIACGTHRQGINVAPEVGRMVSDEVLEGTGPRHVFSPNSHHHEGPKLDLGAGARSLLGNALFPSGEMPYNRQGEMEVFLETLLRMALNDEAADNELRGKLKAISENISMSEQCVLRLFYEVLEERLPERGPYV